MYSIDSKYKKILSSREKSLVLFKSFSKEEITCTLDNYLRLKNSEDLNSLLTHFNLVSVNDFVERMGYFFIDELKIETLKLNEILELNPRKLAFQFADYVKIDLIKFKKALDDDISRGLLTEIGRIFLFEILFPALKQFDIRFAMEVKNMITEAFVRASNVQKWTNRDEVFDSLGLNNLISEEEMKLVSFQEGKKDFLMCSLSKDQMEELATILVSKEKILTSKTNFLHFLDSKGTEIKELLTCKRNKIKVFSHVLYLLRKKSKTDKGKDYYLKMNTGSAFWEFIQKYVVDEDGNKYNRLRKNHSHLMKSASDDHDEIKKDAEDILSEVFKK